MIRRYKITFLSCDLVGFCSLGNGFLLVKIITIEKIRMMQVHGSHMNQISSENQFFSFDFQYKNGMPWRMPHKFQGFNLWNKVHISLKSLYFSSIQIWF